MLNGIELRVLESVYYIISNITQDHIVEGNRVEIKGEITLVNPILICEEDYDERLYEGLIED